MVVIDNGSSDNSVEYISSNHNEVKIIQIENNLGFAGGYNEGLKQLKNDYFIIVNSDIQVTPNWITPMTRILSKNENVVAVQPKILSYNKKQEFEYAGAAGGFIDKHGYPFCRGRILNFVEQDLGQYNTCHEIFWASGACMAVKSNEFFKVGGFDADFFAHMEEIDLCWRWKNAGKSIMYTNESKIYHVGGGTLSYESPRKTFLNYRNNLWMIHKNYTGKSPLFMKIFIRLLLDQLSFYRLIILGQFRNAISIFKAHLNYYSSLKTLHQKRKKIKKTTFSQMKGYFKKSIVWEFFILQNRTFKKLQF